MMLHKSEANACELQCAIVTRTTNYRVYELNFSKILIICITSHSFKLNDIPFGAITLKTIMGYTVKVNSNVTKNASPS